jgi:hypothetical protein
MQLICPVEAGNLFTVTGKQVAIDECGSVPTTGITEELAGRNFTKAIRRCINYRENSGMAKDEQFFISQ